MKTLSQKILLHAALAWLLALSLPARAQETQKTPPADSSAVVAPAPAPDGAPAVEQADKPEDAGKLRRIDRAPVDTTDRKRRQRPYDEMPFGDHTLAEDETAGEVVSILGSTTVAGEARDAAVSVLGDTTVTATGVVRREAVSVLGSTTVDGHVAREAVSVLGTTRVNGRVDKAVVAVLGNVELGPKAIVDGDVVAVGGAVKRAPGAIVRGNVKQVPFGAYDWNYDGIKAYFAKCVMMGRPLAFGDHLGWAWGIALSLFALYVVLALLFPRNIEKCARTLETRPGASVLWAVLAMFMVPIVTILLCVTVVGVVVVPFFLIGMFLAALFGKASMLAWIGRRFAKSGVENPPVRPVVTVLIGGAIVLALYVVPVIGILTLKLLSWLGFGVAIFTLLQGMKREKPAASAVGGTSGSVGVPPTMAPMTSVAAPNIATSDVMASESAAPLLGSVPATTASAPAPMVSAVTSERAGFFIRLAAMLLDLILVFVVTQFAEDLVPRGVRWNMDPPGMLVILAIYAAVLWKLKGTTIGGIVFGLKVVRIDGREIDWVTAIVRGLSCFLSLIVAGLGFIWVAFDDQKQSWHDKIAGTTVVRAPKGTSLV